METRSWYHSMIEFPAGTTILIVLVCRGGRLGWVESNYDMPNSTRIGLSSLSAVYDTVCRHLLIRIPPKESDTQYIAPMGRNSLSLIRRAENHVNVHLLVDKVVGELFCLHDSRCCKGRIALGACRTWEVWSHVSEVCVVSVLTEARRTGRPVKALSGAMSGNVDGGQRHMCVWSKMAVNTRSTRSNQHSRPCPSNSRFGYYVL